MSFEVSRRGLAAAVALLAALWSAGPAAAQQRLPVKIAVGGASCLCYLPTVLAERIGAYEQAGLDVELINFKGGSVALTAVLSGSADIVSGYYDHTVNLAAKKKAMKSIVVYDRFPGLVLVVSPKATAQVKSVRDLVGKKVGVSAPGSSTDFFLKYIARKHEVDPGRIAVIGVGLTDTAVAAMEQGQVDAAVMLDPAVTYLQNKYKDLRILSDTRTQADTQAVFGGDYPGGSLYSTVDWVEKHPKESQALAEALVRTLRWIHSHTPEEIMAKMPKEFVGEDPALYLSALKNTIPMYSKTGLMDPKGARAVLDVFSQSSPEVAQANIDVTRTYTNEFVEKAAQKLGKAD
ncbi:MAG TPA: ABC transporter substrate-binding protein [Thermodesulfobacteriota bacterium]